MTQLIF